MAFKDIELSKVKDPIVRLGNVIYAATILAALLFAATTWANNYNIMAASCGLFFVGYTVFVVFCIIEASRRLILYVVSGVSLIHLIVPMPGRFALAVVALSITLSGVAFLFDGGVENIPQQSTYTPTDAATFDPIEWEKYRATKILEQSR